MKGLIIKQCNTYFVEVNNKRTKSSYAYIKNQKLAQKLYNENYDIQRKYNILVLERPHSGGYSNTHVVHNNNTHCNLIGTNGNVDSVKELLKNNYIPSIIKILK